MTRFSYLSAAVVAASALIGVHTTRTSAQGGNSDIMAPQSTPADAKKLPGNWKTTIRPDGQPQIEGYYQAVSNEGGGSGVNLEPMAGLMGGGRRPSPGIVRDPADGMVPYLPWARARRDENAKGFMGPNDAQVDTRNRAWPDDNPRINYYFVNAFQILQPRGAVTILYESQHEFRHIPLDGRTQIDEGVKLWMGSSRGRWEGTTLVVDIANINDRVRLSVVGDFASDQVRMTERWAWVDADTIRHSGTITDPQVFTRPFTVGVTLKRVTQKNFEIMEYAGVEGEKDAHLMVDIPATVERSKGGK
jgi:hypothetical protein